MCLIVFREEESMWANKKEVVLWSGNRFLPIDTLGYPDWCRAWWWSILTSNGLFISIYPIHSPIANEIRIQHNGEGSFLFDTLLKRVKQVQIHLPIIGVSVGRPYTMSVAPLR